MPSIFFHCSDHVHDVGMVELAQGLAFACETLEQRWVALENLRIEHFDRHSFSGLRIRGAVDLAHPAAAEPILDFKPLSDKGFGVHVLWRHAYTASSAKRAASRAPR